MPYYLVRWHAYSEAERHQYSWSAKRNLLSSGE